MRSKAGRFQTATLLVALGAVVLSFFILEDVGANPPPNCPTCSCKVVQAWHTPTDSVAYGLQNNNQIVDQGIGNIESNQCPAGNPSPNLTQTVENMFTYTLWFSPNCTIRGVHEAATPGDTVTPHGTDNLQKCQ